MKDFLAKIIIGMLAVVLGMMIFANLLFTPSYKDGKFHIVIEHEITSYLKQPIEIKLINRGY